MFVKLLKDHLGQKAGAQIDIDEPVGKALIESKTAEPVHGDPLAPILQKSMEGMLANLTESLKEALRELIRDALDKPCPYCGDRITLTSASIDHVLPVSRGGSWSFTNLVVLDLKCNQRKGDLTAGEFRKLLDAIATFDPHARKSILAKMRARLPFHRK